LRDKEVDCSFQVRFFVEKPLGCPIMPDLMWLREDHAYLWEWALYVTCDGSHLF